VTTFRQGLRRRRALNVAEDQPAHCGVHIQGLACARDDPGEPVVEAESGQAIADAEEPDQIVTMTTATYTATCGPTAP